MPLLPTQRSSLCLFCAFSARPRPQQRLPQRLLPRTQLAQRSGQKSKKRPDARFTRVFYDQESVLDNARRAPEGGPSRSKYAIQPLRKGKGFVPTILFETVHRQLGRLRSEFSQQSFLKSLQLTGEAFDQEWLTFERSISLWIKRATPELETLAAEASKGKPTLQLRLRYMFYAQVCGGRFTQAELDNQRDVADLRYPTEWYPATREISRTVHLHVGPTNSGKTYHALKRLEEADRGIYLGPLRLLAHEVYTRLNAKGKPCALVTGEEQRLPEGDTQMWSCTVEMAPLNSTMDVAVIDEIQMINHKERGWAWTQAFLGLQAKEIHLCGEARTVPLIKELCALVGDKVHVHEYTRLTPLEVAPRALGKLRHLEKGDCVVAFSVLGIHAMRREIEKQTNKKCAMVYGSLPPETRAQQARLFNDPDNDYDFLVASDAVGMGLNLSIKRVIFESIVKNNGTNLVPLQISDLKQIAGRAGRYKTSLDAENDAKAAAAKEAAGGSNGVGLDDAEPEQAVTPSRTVGLVTTLDQMDFNFLKKNMDREPEPIDTAGLFPPAIIVERFASYFPPGTPFSYIMLRLHEISTIHPRFHLCALRDQLAIADAIHEIQNLSISDRIIICSAPTNMKDAGEKLFLFGLSKCIADGTSGHILDLNSLPLERLDKPASAERQYLRDLEQLHKMIVSYLWLSYRFPQVFTSRKLANYIKKITEDTIEKTLTEFSWTDEAQRTHRAMRRKAIQALEETNELKQQDGPERLLGKGMPQEVREILSDKQSFAEDSPPTEDEGRYPAEDQEILGLSPTERLGTIQKEQNQRTQDLSTMA
ncbi:P-loop containing nucleoside triphosphate hydrolase protein [Massarina eburnea CBS 473.64]|uniref:RNA helicase n=1 Tax=Massarina eburnea CBS 473.64 TaxID=1395130 RepID=A0A6A6SEN9_9PLEO|nr:P-loop containing nucleoside triphosphate hydrolase protein [Massarina eburnea CBS 473.64]